MLLPLFIWLMNQKIGKLLVDSNMERITDKQFAYDVIDVQTIKTDFSKGFAVMLGPETKYSQY